MPQSASIVDVRALLKEVCDDAVTKVGRNSAQIMGEAASSGALGNSRIVLVLFDNLEKCWRESVARSISCIQGFIGNSGLEITEMLTTANDLLDGLLPQLIEASRVTRESKRLPQSENDAVRSTSVRTKKLPIAENERTGIRIE